MRHSRFRTEEQRLRLVVGRQAGLHEVSIQLRGDQGLAIEGHSTYGDARDFEFPGLGFFPDWPTLGVDAETRHLFQTHLVPHRNPQRVGAALIQRHFVV